MQTGGQAAEKVVAQGFFSLPGNTLWIWPKALDGLIASLIKARGRGSLGVRAASAMSGGRTGLPCPLQNQKAEFQESVRAGTGSSRSRGHRESWCFMLGSKSELTVGAWRSAEWLRPTPLGGAARAYPGNEAVSREPPKQALGNCGTPARAAWFGRRRIPNFLFV